MYFNKQLIMVILGIKLIDSIINTLLHVSATTFKHQSIIRADQKPFIVHVITMANVKIYATVLLALLITEVILSKVSCYNLSNLSSATNSTTLYFNKIIKQRRGRV